VTQQALPFFERRKPRKAVVRITNAGDGLSEPLKYAPVALRYGEEVFFVLRGVVTQVNHKGDGEDDFDRVHTVKTTEVALIDLSDAEPLLKAAADRLHEHRLAAAAEDHAAGVGLDEEDGGRRRRRSRVEPVD
jgi:hypothetical protein